MGERATTPRNALAPRSSSPVWLGEISRQFKRHRHGRPGWFLEQHRDRLRVRSDELPPRQGERIPRRRTVTLKTPPGPATAAAALAEACALFDGVQAGLWSWPDPEGIPAAGEDNRLSPSTLSRLVDRLHSVLVGERIAPQTWEGTYSPYLDRLLRVAKEHDWGTDTALLNAVLRHWSPNTRSRQMGHDRIRTLWKLADWPWPKGLAALRGNGKATADPEGVRAFTEDEIEALRGYVQASRLLGPSDLLAWDCLAVFGLRPAELQGLDLEAGLGGTPVALVRRQKRTAAGASGARQVPAVPPAGWPLDCYDLLGRWKTHGLDPTMLARRSPGQRLTQQLRRMPLPEGLSAYGMRHAFAMRLGIDLGLSVRESAELMGHSPAVHLGTYGRRLDTPKLHAKVQRLVRQKIMETPPE